MNGPLRNAARPDEIVLFAVTGLDFQCVPPNLIPYGPGYSFGENTGCAMVGAAPGVSPKCCLSFLLSD